MLPAICMILAHLSGCVLDATSPPALDTEDECVVDPTCDAGNDCAPPSGCDAGAAASPKYHAPPCANGQTRACQIILAEHNGVTDCMPGVQRCSDGLWGDECVVDEPAAGPN